MAKEFYTLEEIIKLDTKFQIRKAMKRFGAEGIEDKVKEIYSQIPKIKDYLLTIIHDLWRKNEK